MLEDVGSKQIKRFKTEAKGTGNDRKKENSENKAGQKRSLIRKEKVESEAAEEKKGNRGESRNLSRNDKRSITRKVEKVGEQKADREIMDRKKSRKES